MFAVCLGGVLIGFLLATTLTVNGVLVLGPDELTTRMDTNAAYTEFRKDRVRVRVGIVGGAGSCLPLAGHLWAMQGRKLMPYCLV